MLERADKFENSYIEVRTWCENVPDVLSLQLYFKFANGTHQIVARYIVPCIRWTNPEIHA